MDSYKDKIYAQYVLRQRGDSARDARNSPYGYYLAGWLPSQSAAAIADVGCGDGRLLRFLLGKGYTSLSAVDISADQVERARRTLPSAVHGDALDFLRGHVGAFDLIFAMDIVEHLAKEDVLPFLAACHGALRSGGRLVIQTPNAASPFFGSVRYGDFTHEICFTPDSLSDLLLRSDFTEVECRETAPVRYGRGLRSWLRSFLWKGLRAAIGLFNLVETGSWACGGILTRVFLTSAKKG